MRVGRRGLLGAAGLGALATALSGCAGADGPVREPDRTGEGPIAYGPDPSQFGELYLPEGDPRGVVVVIHGGFWKSSFDLSLGEPLATDLTARGWAAWNLEYRSVGNGGGAPETFDDIAAGIDVLAQTDLDLSTVVTLGHSAGGHLAAWAAARDRFEWPNEVPVTHVISQAGVLDLVAAQEDGLGGGAVEAFLGDLARTDGERYDPIQQVPLDVPIWAVHGREDTIVPPSQSKRYVDAALSAGATAELVETPGDHFSQIDTLSDDWGKIVEVLDSIA